MAPGCRTADTQPARPTGYRRPNGAPFPHFARGWRTCSGTCSHEWDLAVGPLPACRCLRCRHKEAATGRRNIALWARTHETAAGWGPGSGLGGAHACSEGPAAPAPGCRAVGTLTLPLHTRPMARCGAPLYRKGPRVSCGGAAGPPRLGPDSEGLLVGATMASFSPRPCPTTFGPSLASSRRGAHMNLVFAWLTFVHRASSAHDPHPAELQLA